MADYRCPDFAPEYEFHCPECDEVWGSFQSVADREWCPCGTATPPEPLEGGAS